MTETDIRETLQHLADQARPTDLLPGALRRHKRMKVRRNAGAGIGALVVVAAFGGVYAGISDLRHPSVPITAPAVSRSAAAPSPSPSPSSSQPVTSCGRMLSMPQGTTSGGYLHLDPTGHYAASGNTVWHDGVPSIMKGVDGSFEVHAINSSGVAVGIEGGPDSRAWAYRDGKVVLLPKLHGSGMTSATGIDSAGDIVGVADGAPVIWPASDPAAVHKLKVPGGAGGSAQAIGDDGTIVGSLGDGIGPFMWDASGNGHRLTVPSPYHGGRLFAVAGVWGAGWVGTDKSSSGLVPARWNFATGVVTVFKEQTQTAMGVTDTGDVLVTGFESASVLIKADGDRVPITAPQGVDSVRPPEADSISLDGTTIAGWVLTSANKLFPVLWHC